MSRKDAVMILLGSIALVVALTAAVAQPSGEPPMPPPGGPGGPGGPRMMRPTFAEFDQNADGSISADEFASEWAQVQQAEFSRLDTDANGTLSKDELAMRLSPGPQGQGRRGPRHGGNGDTPPPGPPPGEDNGTPPPGPPPGQERGTPPPRPPSAEELDLNSDGNVTLEEYTTGWSAVHESRFKRQDANSDGVLSKDEFDKGPGRGPRRGQRPNSEQR